MLQVFRFFDKAKTGFLRVSAAHRLRVVRAVGASEGEFLAPPEGTIVEQDLR